MKFSDLYSSEEYEISPDVIDNLKILFNKLGELESKFGMPLKITSGYRTKAEHIALYRRLNDKRLIVGQNERPVPLHSMHLKGAAADILDSEGLLKTWLSANVPFMERVGFWAEAFYACPNWTHLQIFPPASGRRFFRP